MERGLSISQDEMGSLRSIFWESGGPSWNHADGWFETFVLDSPSDPCSWFGVNCTITSDGMKSVTSLIIEYNNMVGKMTESICGLPNLQVLSLSNNAITSSIPNCLGLNRQLIELQLGSNMITGSFPISICESKNLQTIFLRDNSLQGTVPTCISALKHLEFLWLDSNQFSGGIFDKLCDLQELIYIEVYSNSFTGSLPECIGQLSALQILGASTNRITGTLPSSLCTLPRLEHLYLYENELSGAIPSCIDQLIRTKTLMLQTNRLEGIIPVSVCSLINLQTLQLHNNKINGRLHDCMANSFPDLVTLSLHDNMLSGPMPVTWNLPSLSDLVLSNNRHLTAEQLPMSLFTPNLRNLIIEGVGIRGALSSSICTRNIETIALSGNHFTGSVPSCLFNSPTLRTIQLAFNKLSGEINSAHFRNNSALNVIDLSRNMIRGVVPANIGQYSASLRRTSLSQNWLSCELPRSVQHWSLSTAFEELDILEGNYFSCPPHSLTLASAPGLHRADPVGAQAYSCGSSEYLIPGVVIALSTALLGLSLVFEMCRGNGAVIPSLGLPEEVVADHRFIHQLKHIRAAESQLFGLARGSIIAGLISVVGLVPLYLVASKDSPYSCQYAATPSLGLKDGGGTLLCVGVGCSVALALFAATHPWFTHNAASDGQFNSPIIESPLSRRETEAEQREGEDFTQAPAVTTLSSRLLTLAILVVLCVASVGPNVAFVYVVLSNASQLQKGEAALAVTVVKCVLSSVLPWASRRTSNAVLPGMRFEERYQMRVNLSAIFFVLLGLASPLAVVVNTDTSCARYYWTPQTKITSTIPVSTCFVFSPSGLCTDLGSYDIYSTFTPKYDFSGSRCVSAILRIYAPVYLLVVLLVAMVPFILEILVVPIMAPFCMRHRMHSFIAHSLLRFFEATSSNVTLVLAPKVYVDSEHIAQRAIERGVTDLCTTLITALTFGLAVPYVGAACVVAALVQLANSLRTFRKAISYSVSRADHKLPYVGYCCRLSTGTLVVVVCSVALFWTGLIFFYLKPIVVFPTIASVFMAAVMTRYFAKRSYNRDMELSARSNHDWFAARLSSIGSIHHSSFRSKSEASLSVAASSLHTSVEFQHNAI